MDLELESLGKWPRLSAVVGLAHRLMMMACMITPRQVGAERARDCFGKFWELAPTNITLRSVVVLNSHFVSRFVTMIASDGTRESRIPRLLDRP